MRAVGGAYRPDKGVVAAWSRLRVDANDRAEPRKLVHPPLRPEGWRIVPEGGAGSQGPNRYVRVLQPEECRQRATVRAAEGDHGSAGRIEGGLESPQQRRIVGKHLLRRKQPQRVG